MAVVAVALAGCEGPGAAGGADLNPQSDAAAARDLSSSSPDLQSIWQSIWRPGR
jgi:hypothetical protein